MIRLLCRESERRRSACGHFIRPLRPNRTELALLAPPRFPRPRGRSSTFVSAGFRSFRQLFFEGRGVACVATFLGGCEESSAHRSRTGAVVAMAALRGASWAALPPGWGASRTDDDLTDEAAWQHRKELAEAATARREAEATELAAHNADVRSSLKRVTSKTDDDLSACCHAPSYASIAAAS